MEDPHTRDREDLAAVRAGDHEAGRRLMAAHGGSMVRTAWHVLGRYGAGEAEDVVQEAFVAALTTPAVPRGDVGAWLRAITVRKALDQARRAGRRAEDPLEEAPPARSADPVPADVLAVREALGRLSPADRAILTMADLEGWALPDVARALGLSHVAVRLRAVRARRRLARLLGKEMS